MIQKGCLQQQTKAVRCLTLIGFFCFIILAPHLVSRKNKAGETPLHKAILNSAVRVLMVKLLIKHGANVNIPTESGGETGACVHACVRACVRACIVAFNCIVQLLVTFTKLVLSSSFFLALHYAVRLGRRDLIKVGRQQTRGRKIHTTQHATNQQLHTRLTDTVAAAAAGRFCCKLVPSWRFGTVEKTRHRTSGHCKQIKRR